MKLRTLIPIVAPLLLSACDGGPLPIQVEVKDDRAAHPDKVELFVKTEPDADLTFQGKTESAGNSPNHSFFIPRSELKLGKNTFTVDGTVTGALSKRTGTATATLDVTPKMILHFQSPSGASQEATFTCAGTMCGATSIGFAKAGQLPLSVGSDIAATVTVDGKKVALAAGAHETVVADLVAKLATISVPQSDSVAIPVTVEANGEKASDSLVLGGSGMRDVAIHELGKIEHGPVTLSGEPAANNKSPESIVVIGAPSAPLILVGNAKVLGDVDLVGIATPTEHRFPCPNGAGLLYIDTPIKVYARRTGAVVATKSLSADRTTCPPTPASEPLKSAVREDDTKRVLAELLKKP